MYLYVGRDDGVIAKLTHHIHKWTGRPGGGRGFMVSDKPGQGGGVGSENP